jgi:hypothetical protein
MPHHADVLDTLKSQAEENANSNDPVSEPRPEKCKACKQKNAMSEWKQRYEAYEKGEGKDPGKKPAHVNRGHVPDCPGYKQRGCGPARKDEHKQHQVGAACFLFGASYAWCLMSFCLESSG